MIYDYRVLTKDESIIVNGLLEHYKGYDKLDMIIEMAVNDPESVLKRHFIQAIKKEEVISQPMPEGVKYCTGDHCTIL